MSQMETFLEDRLEKLLIKPGNLNQLKFALKSINNPQTSSGLNQNQLPSTLLLTRSCSLSNGLLNKVNKSKGNSIKLSRSMTKTYELENESEDVSETCSYAYQELKSSIQLCEDLYSLDKLSIFYSNSSDRDV